MNTQYDIGVCISTERDNADSLLKREFTGFLNMLDSVISEAEDEQPADTLDSHALQQVKILLQNSQKSWTTMRNANAEATWIGLLGGTGRGSLEGAEYIKDTYDRIRRLRELRSTILP